MEEGRPVGVIKKRVMQSDQCIGRQFKKTKQNKHFECTWRGERKARKVRNSQYMYVCKAQNAIIWLGQEYLATYQLSLIPYCKFHFSG